MNGYITDGQPFARLTLVNGTVLDGPWTFFSQGTIGAYPGFVNGRRDYVPMSAVLLAER